MLGRFVAKVSMPDDPDDCWLWTAHKVHDGYGKFWLDGRHVLAHRVSYEWLVGPIPDGLQIDHLCRVRHCVNPAHLEPVTQRENLLRGETILAANAAKTHCPSGHAYDDENTCVSGGWRYCRACNRERMRAYRARRTLDT